MYSNIHFIFWNKYYPFKGTNYLFFIQTRWWLFGASFKSWIIILKYFFSNAYLTWCSNLLEPRLTETTKNWNTGILRLKRCCESRLLNWEGCGWAESSALLCYQKTRPPRFLGSLFIVIEMVWDGCGPSEVRYFWEWVKFDDDCQP